MSRAQGFWRTGWHIAALLAGLWAAPPALAHKSSDAYLTLRVDGQRIEQRFDIVLRDIDRELLLDTNDDGQLQWAEVRAHGAQIRQLAAAGLQISADGQPCTVQRQPEMQIDEHSDGSYAVLVQHLLCAAAPARLQLHYSLFAHTDASHRGLVRVLQGPPRDAPDEAAVHTAVLVPGAPPQVLELQGSGGAGRSFIEFVAQGVHHILIGTDHLLFLLALLLPAAMVRGPQGWHAAPALRPVLLDVLRVVTAFTVAHSITLGLAVADLLDPPSRWVESIIAASVLLAALNNLRPVVGRQRWVITFGFGLVHGFGFAGALKGLGLGAGSLLPPLLGFNVGVELGQLAIVAAFVPLAWVLRATPVYRRAALTGGSVGIALLATVWLAERALNLDWLGVA